MDDIPGDLLRIGSLGSLAGFLTLFPALLVSCGMFLLVSGVLVAPVCLALFIYDAAHEELDFFSYPVVLLSIAKDFAIFIGLKQESALSSIDYEDNDYYNMSLGTKAVHPRRQSFISDFSEPEDVNLNSGSPRKKCHISSARINNTVPKTATTIARRAGSYSILSFGVPGISPLRTNIIGSPSSSCRSAASIVSIEGFLRTPEQKLFNFSRRKISPHWSVGKQTSKSDTPSPLELSPGELEYPDEYVPSPKRWPSPVSDTGYLITRHDSLRIRLQNANDPENIEATDRMFVADDIGNTHVLGIDESAQMNTNNVQHIDQSKDCHPFPQKLERKLFTTRLQDRLIVDTDTALTPNDSYKKTDGFPSTEYNKETSLTTGWNRKYKNLIAEMKLKGSLVKQESEEEDQSKIENFKPIADIDPHWMDTPRLEPLERPRLNKLQRWGLSHRSSRANLIDQGTEESNRRSMTPTPNEFPSLRASPITLKEDYNFGNLEMSPEKRGTQSDPDDDDFSKYWEGFDEAYNTCDSKSPGKRSDEEEKWKLSMGKWAEKGVEVMKPVNEEGRDDGNFLLSPDPKRAVRWPSPVSQSSEREPLLRGSPASEDENTDGNYLTDMEYTEMRTPSPPLLLSVLGDKIDVLGDKKNITPLEEASNRLFGRRMSRASRLPAGSSPTLTSPPRPLPVKLIRMFEDLSKPLSIGPRSSSINSSPERIHSSPDRSESYRSNEARGLGINTGNISQANIFREVKKKPVASPKGHDDGLNECF